MSDEHVLTKATAEQYVANPSVVDIKAFKSIDDDAADFLGRFCKQSLAVDGVARMTPLQAASLSRIPGALFLRGLTTLDEATAESLAHNVKTLDLSGLSHISAEAAAALGRHQGDQLRLNGLTAIDDTSATGLGSYGGSLLELRSLSSLTAPAALALSRVSGDIWLHGLTALSDEAAAQLRGKTTGKVSFVYRETDPFPSCSDDGLLLLYSCPAVSLSPDIAERVARLVKQKASESTLPKSVQKTIKSYLSTADASDATKAVEALKPFAANDNEILSVLSATSCKKLVKTCIPSIWKALSLMCNESPCGEGLFLRSVAEFCDATTNKSPYLSELRDMLGELCELTKAECPLLMRAVELFVSRANEHRDFVLCHGDWSGSLPATMQGTTLSADMAKALSQYRGTLSLRLDSLTDDSAEILAKSKLSTLILHGLKRISEAATHALATFPGYLKVESESLSLDLHNAIHAGRHFVRDGYYEPES